MERSQCKLSLDVFSFLCFGRYKSDSHMKHRRLNRQYSHPSDSSDFQRSSFNRKPLPYKTKVITPVRIPKLISQRINIFNMFISDCISPEYNILCPCKYSSYKNTLSWVIRTIHFYFQQFSVCHVPPTDQQVNARWKYWRIFQTKYNQVSSITCRPSNISLTTFGEQMSTCAPIF